MWLKPSLCPAVPATLLHDCAILKIIRCQFQRCLRKNAWTEKRLALELASSGNFFDFVDFDF